MPEPVFWSRPPDRPGFRARALAPLSALWAKATARRLARGEGYRASVPVICVGNVNAGGTGKTPSVIAIVQHLQAAGWTPHVLSRGFGGRVRGPLRVQEGTHAASDVGDEPLLHAAFAPTWIGADRAATARLAQADGADILVMDDGLQNPGLHKDVSVIVVNAGRGFGNGRVIPAGPLREPVTAAAARSDLVLAIGSDRDRRRFADNWGSTLGLPVVPAQLEVLQTGINWTGMKVVAFAGIAHPDQFFATLRSLGAEVLEQHALADHATLPPQLLTRLLATARRNEAQLVTTEKDAVRLPSEARAEVMTLPVRLTVADWDALDQAMARKGIARG